MAKLPAGVRPRDMNGVGASLMGDAYGELLRRGLIPANSNAERLTNELEKWSGPVAAVRDLMAANGRVNPPAADMFKMMDTLVQGAPGSMTPGNIQMMVRRVHSMASSVPGGLDKYLSMLQTAGGMAEAAGRDRSLAAMTTQASMAFGKAFAAKAGNQGLGGLSPEEAASLDMQLRTSAAASPMANTLGALMAMHADGLIKGGDAMEIVRAIQTRDQAKLQQLVRMTPKMLIQILQASGVSGAAASQYMAARDANQEFIARYGIQDVVRQMQGEGEIATVMRSGLQSGMSGVLREAGIDRQTALQITRVASERARQAIMGMDGDLLSNPERRIERNKAVASAIREALGGDVANRLGEERLQTLAASSIRGLEGMMGRNPSLKKFKNLAGLVSVNRGDVLGEGNRLIAGHDVEGDLASLTSGIGQGSALSRLMDAVAGAGSDTKLLDVIMAALNAEGNPNSKAAAAALTPAFTSLNQSKKNYALLQKRYGEAKSDDERKTIEMEMAGLKSHTATLIEKLRPVAESHGVGSAAKEEKKASSPPSHGGGLAARDAEVRAHEHAHAAMAGPYGSGPEFTYMTGPDGNRYAVGGSVTMDLSPVHGDPAATMAKMDTIEAAASSPGMGMSSDDISVAQRASQNRGRARHEMVTSSRPDLSALSRSGPSPASPMRAATPIDLSGASASKPAAPSRITGTLLVRPDGTADIDAGYNSAGSAPAPSS